MSLLNALSPQTYQYLFKYNITHENIDTFFSPSGGIRKKTIAVIEEIITIISRENSNITLRMKKSSERKEGYINYICHYFNPTKYPLTEKGDCNLNHSFTQKSSFKEKNSTIHSSTPMRTMEHFPFQTANDFLSTFNNSISSEPHLHQHNKVPSTETPSKSRTTISGSTTGSRDAYPFNIYGDYFNFVRSEKKPKPMQIEKKNSFRENEQVPVEFFETQHPRYFVTSILYSQKMDLFQRNIFQVNTSTKKSNEKIFIRFYDTVIKNESNEVYPIALNVNYSEINLDNHFKEIIGMPHSEPMIIREPIDITNKCYSTENRISIYFNRSSQDLMIVVGTCKLLSKDELIQNVKEHKNKDFVLDQQTNCYGISLLDDENQTMMNEKKDDYDDVEEECIKIPLRCPLSFLRISCPVKGAKCQHRTVLDCKGLIEYCCHNGYWNCPICEKPCLYKDIEIDDIMEGIIVTAPDDCGFVQIDGNEVQYLTDNGDECVNDSDVIQID